jgi:methyl-accepting chemotaxis protein
LTGFRHFASKYPAILPLILWVTPRSPSRRFKMSQSRTRSQMMRNSKLLLALFAVVLITTPAFSVSKEIVQLQTQVQALQDQMTQMRQSFDERMGVMRNLIEQSTDNVNKAVNAVNDLNQNLQKSHSDTGARADQLSGQIQALNDSVDELKARMAKLSQQLDAIQNAQQNITQPPPAGQNATPAGGPPGAANQAPPADVLYNNALRDYNSGNFDCFAGIR